jgi:DNA replication ATP-dependent helicase Dna2
MSLDLALFQENLRRFVLAEQSAQKSQLERIWSRPLEDRIEEGRCLAGGRIIEVKNSRHVLLQFAANDARFREGDYIRLSRGNPEEPWAEGVVVQAEDERVELDLPKSARRLEESPREWSDWQIDESALDLSDLYLGAIEELGRTEVGRDRILPLLTGTARSKLDLAEYENGEAGARDDGFDDEQSAAVASALSCDLCWLIHGPPGTGKTRVLAWAVREMLARGERVLITGANHRTINLLLEAIAQLLGDSRSICKIAPFMDPACTLPQYESFQDIPAEKTSGACVLGATPYALRSRRLRGVDFDTVVIDEASQVSVALAVMAMLAGKRYVLAGDHHQLPPVTVAPQAGNEAEHSIFGRLIGRGMDTMLATTHRLNEPLCLWPSEQFYQSLLRPSATAGARRFRPVKPPVGYEEILSPEPACVWLAVDHLGSRSSSPEEVEAVAELLLALRESGVPWSETGVVVPFRRQARLLRQRLRRQLNQPLASSGLIADTVERMQGQEREVIMVSFTTSDELFALRLADFLFQPQRLNVAATRPRTKLILVASPHLLHFVRRTLPGKQAESFTSLLAGAWRCNWSNLPAAVR